MGPGLASSEPHAEGRERAPATVYLLKEFHGLRIWRLMKGFLQWMGDPEEASSGLASSSVLGDQNLAR